MAHQGGGASTPAEPCPSVLAQPGSACLVKHVGCLLQAALGEVEPAEVVEGKGDAGILRTILQGEDAQRLQVRRRNGRAFSWGAGGRNAPPACGRGLRRSQAWPAMPCRQQTAAPGGPTCGGARQAHPPLCIVAPPRRTASSADRTPPGCCRRWRRGLPPAQTQPWLPRGPSGRKTRPP